MASYTPKSHFSLASIWNKIHESCYLTSYRYSLRKTFLPTLYIRTSFFMHFVKTFIFTRAHLSRHYIDDLPLERFHIINLDRLIIFNFSFFFRIFVKIHADKQWKNKNNFNSWNFTIYNYNDKTKRKVFFFFIIMNEYHRPFRSY